MTVDWTPPATTGGCKLDGYVLEYKMDTGFKWSRASRELIDGTSFKVENLMEDMQYEFRVAAVNQAGQGPFSDNSSRVVSKAPLTGTAPSVMHKMKPKTVVAPGEVAMECGFDFGEPEGSVHWYKDTREVYADHKYEMTKRGELAVLKIKETELSDASTYKVEVANKLGRVSSDAPLTVHGK